MAGTDTHHTVSPYVKGIFPTIEGNDRVFFDTEFRKIEDTLNGVLNALTPLQQSKTIASGVVTIEDGTNPVIVLTVDTESAASTDDLDTITGGFAGQLLIVKAANDARSVVCKDSTGNLEMAGDFTLNNTQDSCIFVSVSATEWHEISRTDAGA